MIQPPIWSPDELRAAAEIATDQFRKQRIEEPLEDYLETFDDYQGHVEDLLETTLDLMRFDASAIEILTP